MTNNKLILELQVRRAGKIDPRLQIQTKRGSSGTDKRYCRRRSESEEIFLGLVSIHKACESFRWIRDKIS